QFVENFCDGAHMGGAGNLGQSETANMGAHRGLYITHRLPPWAVDAHDDVKTLLSEPGRRSGHGAARFFLLARRNSVLKVEVNGVGVPIRGPAEETLVEHGNEQHGTPCAGGVAHCETSSEGLSCMKPSSRLISSVCSPTAGAGWRNIPGVAEKRGIIFGMGIE